MEDDLVLGLTRQVKEEVIENYVLERRLIELQVEYVKKKAEESSAYAESVGKRLTRLSFLMIRQELKLRLQEVLGLQKDCYWTSFITERYSRQMPLIEVRGLTWKGRFRKLIVESYLRFSSWMKEYRAQYEELIAECTAVNSNIDSFQKNFDLLSILNFLRNLDLPSIEKKKILGDNFTAKEMAQLDTNLYIKPISVEKFRLAAPLDLPSAGLAERMMSGLADEILLKDAQRAKKILQ